jgi:hypothetical protein
MEKIGFFKRLQNRTAFGYILKLLALIDQPEGLALSTRRRRRRRRCCDALRQFGARSAALNTRCTMLQKRGIKSGAL